MKKSLLALAVGTALTASLPHATFAQAPQKPHIVVIWGDDIGTWNISHNSRGMMGYMTPASTALPVKVCRSPTITANRAALPAALPSSAARCRSAPA
jgi:hypothetical protein